MASQAYRCQVGVKINVRIFLDLIRVVEEKNGGPDRIHIMERNLRTMCVEKRS
ncbi:hypothetical protein TRIUR3_17331 [Triticum urartu]|uniref:Uncharacterized protein n=1 Tax=Triticum urartu TaxID=4572 RepID=M7Z3T8_TRIUA|nr:hypothetical protein TRIUR3_17331 [Triticum urartu]